MSQGFRSLDGTESKGRNYWAGLYENLRDGGERQVAVTGYVQTPKRPPADRNSHSHRNFSVRMNTMLNMTFTDLKQASQGR
jgi:hypothetical protein